MRDKVTKKRQAKGARVGTSKLTPDVVEEIKRTYIPKSKEYGALVLARRFGVSRQTIHHIVTRQTWA